MLLICTRMAPVCTRMFLVCTGILLVCSRMLLVCTRMLFVCTRMLFACTRMLLACTRMLLVWCFSHDRRLQLPVYTRDRDMFCWPTKSQSFNNQTSNFTRPLENVLAQVLAPLRNHLKRSKVRNGYVHFVFDSFENQNDRKSVEEFMSHVDCDPLQYTRELKCH